MTRYGMASLVIPLLFLVGCNTVGTTAKSGTVDSQVPTEGITYLEGAARYGDLVREVEYRLKAGEAPTTDLLAPLCLAYESIKNYDKVFACSEQLEARIRQGDKIAHGDYFVASEFDAEPVPWMVRADAYLEMGQYQKSLDNATKALALVGDESAMSTWPPNRFKISLLATMVIAASLNGDTQTANHSLHELEDLPISFIGSAMISPLKENGLARSYLALNQYEKALDHLGGNAWAGFVRGMANFTNPFAYKGDDLSTVIEIPRMVMRARAFLGSGQYVEARTNLDELLKLPRIADFGELYWIVLYDRAQVAEHDQSPVVAVKYYVQAIEVIEQERTSINTEANKIGFVGDKQAVYGRVISLLLKEGKVSEAFGYVERSKARALVDMLASIKNFDIQIPDPERARLVLAQLDQAAMDSRIQDERNFGNDKGTRNLAVARQDIRQIDPDLSSLVTVNAIPSDELKKLVGQNESLVEYYYQGDEMYAFVLDREQLSVMKLDEKDVVAGIRALRDALAHGGPNSLWQEQAKRLYSSVWHPLEGKLRGKDVIVVPHGALHYLPFASLLAQDDSFLIDHYSLRYLPSASVLKFLKPAQVDKRAPILVMGNPDLGNAQYDLQFAEGEAKAVAQIFPGSRLLLRKAASETNFKQAAGIFSRFHFATHGMFRADDPLNSGLYLAKDAQNDGLLTVGDLYAIRLDADLVTLSACETGLGKVDNGDDVIGLTRGFLYAGSRSIVASLWSVDDRATEYLMESFYLNLSRMDKVQALRQAQIMTRQKYPNPYYWAAFQLTGRAD